MKVKANFLARFWDLFGVEEKEVELESGASVRDLVERLCHTKECYQAIFDESGRPRGEVKILRKGREVQLVDAEHSKLDDGDVVNIYPPVMVR